MKKIPIYLVLCTLGFCSLGQGSAYITKSSPLGAPQLIRQWKTCTLRNGAHAIYFMDTLISGRSYIGITDVYNTIRHAHVLDNFNVKDMEVFNDVAYFCGNTITGKPLLGWVNLYDLVGANATLYIDSLTFNTVVPALNTIDNIEVYLSSMIGRICVAGYGSASSGYLGFEYIMPSVLPSRISWGNLPYTPLDVVATDQYVVFAGTFTSSDIVIHPFVKGQTFTQASVPYNLFAVALPPIIEPYNGLRIVDIGSDKVATLTHRQDMYYYMLLREFDVASAFPGGTVTMLTTYKTQFNYSLRPGTVFGFLYDANIHTYVVLQRYEVSPAVFRDVVTKIDFSSGMPSSVQSDYSSSGYSMKSISLSDSSMYVAYAYDTLMTKNLYWKDHNTATVPSGCLYSDILPIGESSTAPYSTISFNYGCPYVNAVYASQRIIRVISETISQQCHY